MGYDYYCLLGADGPLEEEESEALEALYAEMVAEGSFPRLGVVGHTGSGGLGCGLEDWARTKLRQLARGVPRRKLVLWCVYSDLTGIERVAVQGDGPFEEENLVSPDVYRPGLYGSQLMPHYPIGALVIPYDLGPLLEADDYPMDI